MKSFIRLLIVSFFMVGSMFSFSNADSISAYYTTSGKSVSSVKSALQANGFEVLSTYQVAPSKTIITVTNSQLKNTNTFIAALNIFVNGSNEVVVQNPEYFALAYLGKNYTRGSLKNTVLSLARALGQLQPTSDILDSSKIPHYHFMIGMPYFEDQTTVAKGANLKPKSSLYQLSLPNGNILVGHKLSSAKGFLKKINSENKSALLPYQSMILGNKAVILAPKYYLALSLPLLKMGTFMKISDIPSKIEDDISKQY